MVKRWNNFEKLFRCFISDVTTSDTKMKSFHPFKKSKIISKLFQRQ